MTGHKFRWFGAIAVLLAVLVIAACGSDPTATPEPTATPVPAVGPTPTPVPPTSTPEPTEPPAMMMEDLRITPATTGQDLVSHISEAEAACLSSTMGDANFQLFQATPITLAATQAGAYTLFADCLEQDNLVVLGVGLMSANAGGWGDESLACVTDLARENPELIYHALAVVDPTIQGDAQVVLLDMYECLNTTEKVAFSLIAGGGTVEVAPFTGQHFLDVLTEAEVECLQNSLPEAVFAMIATAPSVAGGELADAPPQMLACISPESFAILPVEILIHGLGATSDASHDCIYQFVAEHEHYIDLVRRLSESAESMSPEEFVEIASDGFKLFSCLTDEELALLQETLLPLLLP